MKLYKIFFAIYISHKYHFLTFHKFLFNFLWWPKLNKRLISAQNLNVMNIIKIMSKNYKLKLIK